MGLNSTNIDLIFCLISRYLNTSDLLISRLVCKEWHKVMSKYLGRRRIKNHHLFSEDTRMAFIMYLHNFWELENQYYENEFYTHDPKEPDEDDLNNSGSEDDEEDEEEEEEEDEEEEDDEDG